MEWEEVLHNLALISLLKAQGMQRPTEIQAKVLPPAVEYKQDLIIAAKTGSGKTLCFGIPLMLTTEKGGGLQGLVICPTRELCLQLETHLKNINFPGLNILSLIGGLSVEKQERLIARRPEIVISTPGRLWELISERQNEYLLTTPLVKSLVIDEADRMMEMGHFNELKFILEFIYKGTSMRADPPVQEDPGGVVDLNFGFKIEIDSAHFMFGGTDFKEFLVDSKTAQKTMKKLKKQEKAAAVSTKPVKRQTFLVSATLTAENQLRKNLYKTKKKATESVLEKLMKTVQFRGKPRIIDLTDTGSIPTSLSDYKIPCTDLQKLPLLHYLLSQYTSQKTIVFTNSIPSAKTLSKTLQKLSYSISKLEGKMNQKNRLTKIEKFLKGNDILVATDIACRGLDLPEVKLIIHFNLPQTAETYIHRCGRTARIERQGTSIAFVSPNDIKQLRTVQLILNRKLEKYPVNWQRVNELGDISKTAQELTVLENKLERTARINQWNESAASSTGLESEHLNSKVDRSVVRRLREDLRRERETEYLDPLLRKRISVITPELFRKAKKLKII